MDHGTTKVIGREQAPGSWKYSSPDEPGFHAVVTPGNSSCTTLWMFRLNLRANMTHRLLDQELEMVAGLVTGELEVSASGQGDLLGKLDAFYVPAAAAVDLKARTDCTLYIGAAVCENMGCFFVQRFDPKLPIGETHQIHGEPPYEREVHMTLKPQRPASRLIAGWTFSRPGGWTSWPPHQHERDLEEVYAYFDMPAPTFGLHLSYRNPGEPEAVHLVRSGDMVIAPCGYHPTVAIPGSRNSYFWVLAAHNHAGRRYDLAVADPLLAPRGKCL